MEGYCGALEKDLQKRLIKCYTVFEMCYYMGRKVDTTEGRYKKTRGNENIDVEGDGESWMAR